MSEPRYNDLMTRREILFEEWMRRVEEDKRTGNDPSFFGTGVLIHPNGTLRMTAYDRNTGRPLWDLIMEPFSHQIREERVDEPPAVPQQRESDQ